MQNLESNDTKKIIFQNREIYRSQIRSEKTEKLFQLKRLKYQNKDFQNSFLITDAELIAQILETFESVELAKKMEELRKRSCNLERNPEFFKNEQIYALIPFLIKCLEDENLQYVSSWILINLLIGDTQLIKFCIESGLLFSFLKIVEKNDVAMREQV